MATTIRELLVRVGVDADEKKVAAFDAALESTKATMVKVTGVALVAAGAIAGLAIATAQAGDDAAKAATRLGLPTETLQELEFAAQKSGAEVSELRDGLKEISRRAVEAAEKGGEAADGFNKLGINVRDANGQVKAAPDLLSEIADAISGVNNEAAKIQIADRIAGEAGVKLLPLLKSGSAGIANMRAEARALGVVMSEDATKASEKFLDSMTDVKALLTGVRNQIGVALIPIFTRFLDRVRDWFLGNRQIIKQKLDAVIDGITAAVGFLERAFEKVNERVQDVGGWGVIFEQVKKVVKALVVSFGIAKLIKAFGILQAVVVGIGAVASALGGPLTVAIVVAAAALLAILLIGEDFLVFMRGGESSIGDFLDAFGAKEETRATFLEYLNQVKRLGKAVIAFFQALVDIFGPTDEELQAINTGFDKLVKTITDFINAAIGDEIKRINSEFTKSIKAIDAFATALESPREVIEAMLDSIEGLLANVDKLKGSRVGKLLGSTVGRTPGGRVASAAGGVIPGLLGGFAARGRAGLASFGPSGAAAGGTSTSNVNVAGTQVTINAPGGDPATIASELEKIDASNRRKAFAAAQGGER